VSGDEFGITETMAFPKLLEFFLNLHNNRATDLWWLVCLSGESMT